MKVFISWSGEGTASHKIALALHDWLPCVINVIRPFVSTEDIQKGERGLSIIEEQLRDSGFGIICVTRENYKAAWLLFEAGALSNNLNRVPVVPFLFGLSPSELRGSPLIQFQATINTSKESVKKLLKSLNNACGDKGLQESLLDKAFEMWYPEFEKSLSCIKTEINLPEDKSSEKIDINRSILEEILEISHSNQRTLSSTDPFSSKVFYSMLIKPYEFIVEFEIDNGNIIKNVIQVTEGKSLSDVLDEIYFMIKIVNVRAFTYLIEWMLQDKNSGRELVVSGVQSFIPAHILFERDSIWKVKFLTEPYVACIESTRRWYRN